MVKTRVPKISVILPTYNRADMIREAINSVLNQTERDFELIIINDGSTDNTENAVLSFKDPRMVYLKLKKQGGPAQARNCGLKRIKGKYVSYIDDDDIYYPDHLKLLSGFLDKSIKTGFVYGNAYIRKDDVALIPWKFVFSKKKLELDNFIPFDSVMYRAKCIKKVGFFDEELVVASDWDMWLRISDRYKISHLNKFISEIRVHNFNRTVVTSGYYKWYLRVITKRLGGEMYKKSLLSFEDYCTGILYRLIYKFKIGENESVKIVKNLFKEKNGKIKLYDFLCRCRLTNKIYSKIKITQIV